MGRSAWIVALTLAATSAASVGQPVNNYTYVCELDNSRRLIEVVYLLPDQKVPCEVRYQKDEETAEVLWRADNQEGFCESNAQSLIKQQRDWGFTCDSNDPIPRSTAFNLY
ncbi:hypothetical protein [Gilvimarinus agarilyticus]|uniref:hypothetical protein n=1 Tax=Gilvimarinus agarilyticus TaxID=679259 RepID=UPI0006964A36|nr:hypothetical protein [Gilvimarinus agarilyticus]